MRSWVIALVVAVPGCSRAPEPAPKEASVPRPAGAPCTDAAGCDKGCSAGRLDDCHELAWRKIGARGTAIDLAGAEKLLARACAGKVLRSCGMAAWLAAGRGQDLDEDRRVALEANCAAGDGWSCGALANWGLRSQAGATRDLGRGANWAKLGCEAGHVWSCATLKTLMDSVSPARSCVEANVQPQDCGRYVEEKGLWTREMQERRTLTLALATDKLAAACAAGDRAGCGEGGPEYMVLVRRDCAAADYGACAELASYSEDLAEGMRAAMQACERGELTSSCGLACNGLRDGAAGEPDLGAARACYEKACAAGEKLACEARDAGPLLGGGCDSIDRDELPHIKLAVLPRLVGERRGGGQFDSSKAEGKRRLYLFSASWDIAGPLRLLQPLAVEMAAAKVEVVAVLSDPNWDRLHELDAGSFVAVLDPPAQRDNIGPFTTRLGISKVPEALLVDESGAIRRHLVGPGVLLSPINAVRCAEEILGRPR
jgi:hypothetical protein